MDSLFDRAKQLIDRESTKAVSFDLFDTLILRPLLSGTDVLRLLARSIQKEYGIDVEAARLCAQSSLGDPFATTQMLWHSVADHLGFPLPLADMFAQKEFELEKKLLFPREIGKRIYDYAVSRGKRIIIVSDMHFTSSQLTVLLDQWGYRRISKVYVSCERKAVKRTGELFDVVLADEAPLEPWQIVHIGDSQKADVLAPQSRGICALHLPKDIRILSAYLPVEQILSPKGDDLYAHVVYGFAVSRFMQDWAGQKDPNPLAVYTHLVVWPMLLHVVLQLLTSPQIQESGKYRKLFFASRDGYLTKKAYDILAPSFAHRLESHYLLTSRIACRILCEDHCYDRLTAPFLPDSCTLRDFIIPTVTDPVLRREILSGLPEEALSTPVKEKPELCIAILSPYESRLEAHHQEKKKAAFQYYSALFGDAPSVLIADCGFSGTISDFLTKGFHGAKKFDKAFFWENEKNKHLDALNGTTTYTAFPEKKGHAVAPMAESLFSETAGSCLGFSRDPSGRILPVYEELWQPETMISDIQFVQVLAVDLTRQFHELFGDLLPLLRPQPLPAVMAFMRFFSTEKKCFTASLFGGIRFKESYESHMKPESLGDLILHRSAKGRSQKI